MLPSDIETRDALRHLSAPADTSKRGMSRRRFLQAAALGAGGIMAGPSLSGLVPGWEEHMAAAAPLGPTEGVLVVLLMAGGNDALNTVVPHGQPSYYTKRGSLAIPASSTWGLGHPALASTPTCPSSRPASTPARSPSCRASASPTWPASATSSPWPPG